MHRDILTKNQTELLPLIKSFSKDFVLVGGTAMALHIGHRRSIDFDLFSNKPLNRNSIMRTIKNNKYPTKEILYEAKDQIHITINMVKMTFLQFPHKIKSTNELESIIKIPPLLDLAAMKAFALGGRVKWKDYVDLYFILKDHYDLKMVSNYSKKLFKTFFNEKLFREQLCYFKDIDYSESIEYYGEEISKKEIEKFLTEVATAQF